MYTDYDEKRFLRSLKKFRKAGGYTQKAVEKILKLRALAIFDFERGRIKLPIELSIRLCNLYRCSLSELYSLEVLRCEDEGLTFGIT